MAKRKKQQKKRKSKSAAVKTIPAKAEQVNRVRINRVRKFFKEFGAVLSREFPWVMFTFSLVFLVLIAALIVTWVDIPRVDNLTEAEANAAVKAAAELGDATEVRLQVERDAAQDLLEKRAINLGRYVFWVLLAVWPVFWLEQIFAYLAAGQTNKIGWKSEVFQALIFICPPLRLAAPNRFMDQRIWIPGFGWRRASKELSESLERVFSTPMLVIALLILPILSIEFGLPNIVEANFWLRLTLHICTGLIWIAFSVEFIMMVCVTEKRIDYVKKNWIDLAIIMLPLVSFMRTLRFMRTFKVAKYAKAKQLAKMGRVYRMRGLSAKVLRALMVFEIIGRILRISPERKLETLQGRKADKEEELAEIELEIQKIEAVIAEKQAAKTATDSASA